MCTWCDVGSTGIVFYVHSGLVTQFYLSLSSCISAPLLDVFVFQFGSLLQRVCNDSWCLCTIFPVLCSALFAGVVAVVVRNGDPGGGQSIKKEWSDVGQVDFDNHIVIHRGLLWWLSLFFSPFCSRLLMCFVWVVLLWIATPRNVASLLTLIWWLYRVKSTRTRCVSAVVLFLHMFDRFSIDWFLC